MLTVCCNEKFNFSKLSEYLHSLHTYVMNATKGPSINHEDKEGGSKTFQKVREYSKSHIFSKGWIDQESMLVYKGAGGGGAGGSQNNMKSVRMVYGCPKSTSCKVLRKWLTLSKSLSESRYCKTNV